MIVLGSMHVVISHMPPDQTVCFASKKEAENACAEPASVVLSAGAADGDGCQQQARAERSSLSLVSILPPP
jgi:hypothetical protein